MSAENHLSRIEAIIAEIEQLDRATGGRFREADDREAFDMVARIERKMKEAHGSTVKEEANA